MRKISRGIVMTTAALFVLSAMLAAPAVRAAEGFDYKAMLERNTQAIVIVKFLLKISPPGGEPLSGEADMSGVIISEDGIVLCSNVELGGYMTLAIARRGGPDLIPTPSEFRVIIEGEDEPREAEMLAIDREIDLVWLKIDAGDKKFPHIDFKDSATPSIGDHVYWLGRTSEVFDHAMGAARFQIVSMPAEPRKIYQPGSDVGLNLPVFSAAGKPVGVTIMLTSDEEGDYNDPFTSFMAQLRMQTLMKAVVLPAADVVKATERALATAEEE